MLWYIASNVHVSRKGLHLSSQSKSNADTHEWFSGQETMLLRFSFYKEMFKSPAMEQ